jgi:hypothetical protein
MDEFQKLDPAQQKQFLFMVLVQQHEQIAMMGLGKIKNPATDKIEKELSQAKFAIDTLEMLEHYTKGNLSKDAQDYLTFVLSNLRLNYAQEVQNG